MNSRAHVSKFIPTAEQAAKIQQALKSHRRAQRRGRYAPRRLIERWSAEAGIEPQNPAEPNAGSASEEGEWKCGDDDS
ncbi:hypothetical protein OKW26_001690 [Paraburkholderia sp. 32]